MTTLRLKQETKQKLAMLKEEFNAKSYDDLLEQLVEKVRLKVSLFGINPDLPDWKDVRGEMREDRY